MMLNGFIEPNVLGPLRLALKQQAKKIKEESEKNELFGGYEIYFKPTRTAKIPISLELNERILVHVTEKQKSVVIQVLSLPLSSSKLVGHHVANPDWQ